MTTERYKSLVVTKMWAIRAVLVTGVIISYVSLLQTVTAFEDWSDPNIPFIGLYIPLVMGIFFQYGQTVALYMKERFGNDKPIYDLPWFTSNSIWISVFVFCGIIDAATNIIWFENTVVQRVRGEEGNILLYRIMAYPLLVLTVMVEEGLAWVSEGHRKIMMEYKAIRESEKRVALSQVKNLQGSGNERVLPVSSQNNSRDHTNSSFAPSKVASFNRPAPKPTYEKPRGSVPYTGNKPEPTYHSLGFKPAPTSEPFDEEDDDIAAYLARKAR